MAKKDIKKSDVKVDESLNKLYLRVSEHIDKAKQEVQRSIDVEMVKAYWLTGREIILAEQQGQTRAKYGTSLLEILSEKLTQKYQRGFSLSTLKDARKFYVEYQSIIDVEKSHTLCGQSDALALPFEPSLSWSHYRELMRIGHAEKRQFYELETISNQWSVRELKRQMGSLLFDRLLMSKDKNRLLKLATEGQEINDPSDAIKDPVILEFLGLPESHRLIERKVEEALIQNLQDFLLEMGKGFAFVARQKRLSFDNDHYYADLVFYHVILKCYVIIDIKTRKLKHGDLGQIQTYVNYYDKEIKRDDDNPTIGLVLCTEKRDAMVQYFLGETEKRIFASEYQFHLPTIAQLEKELKRELKNIEHDFNVEDERKSD